MIKNTLDTETRNKYNNSLNPSNKVITKTETKNNESFLVPDLTIEAVSGLYITKCFYKGQKLENIYNQFTTIVKEQKKEKNKNKSNKTKFDNNLLKEIDNKVYFSFFFPFKLITDDIIGPSDVYIVQMDILELPFNITFEFKSADGKFVTYTKLNNKNIEEYINNSNFFEVNQEYNIPDSKFYKLTLWKVTDEKKTYSQFIDEIISNKTNSDFIKKVTSDFLTKDDIIKKAKHEHKDALQSGNYVIPEIEYSINATKITGRLKNNTDHHIKFYNKIDNITKKIHLINEKKDAKKEKTTDDYWELCVKPDLTLSGDGLTFSNYYDISFDCAHLKTFMYSYNVPGYYVLDYVPREIYRDTADERNQLKFKDEFKEIIDFNNVYIDIFKNKIIELKLEKI